MKFHGAPDCRDMNAPGAVHQGAAQGPNRPLAGPAARGPRKRGQGPSKYRILARLEELEGTLKEREGTLKEPSILYPGAGKAQKLRLGPKR